MDWADTPALAATVGAAVGATVTLLSGLLKTRQDARVQRTE